MNYSLLKESALRRKMADLGLRGDGTKALLVKRHTEWVNLVNANCDSKTPKSKKDLLRELDVWDRTHGRHIVNNPSMNTYSISHKDFDSNAWATNHGQDFKKLIAEARQTRQAKREDQDVRPVFNGDTLEGPTQESLSLEPSGNGHANLVDLRKG